MTLRERLIAVWEHLGLGAAHVAAPMPGDLAQFAMSDPQRIAGLVLCTPSRLDPAPFAGLAGRLLMIAGARGLTAEVTARAASRLPGATRAVLAEYDAPGWADVVADRTDEIVGHLTRFLDRASAPGPAPSEGSCAGIPYRVEGAGPALVLLPFFLAPSQWEPAIPALARHFTVVTLGGQHIGGVAALEDRARAPSYRAMAGTLFDLLAPPPGESVLDVGCGSGALDRLFADRYGVGCKLVATDVNPFLLREAERLAVEAGNGAAIRFQRANAEALPFADDSFAAAFSVTVLEECDADRALAELRRVVRPGGRVGVIVRAIDLPQWWNLPLPDGLRDRAERPPQSVGARGVADASLYARMRAAGFADVTGFPSLVTLDRPDGPIWHYREDHVLSQLAPDETAAWHALTAAARRGGVLMMAHPMHCAVGVRL